MKTDITIRNIPKVPVRVHIAPVGYEEDRIVEAALKMRAEKVVLISNVASQDKAKNFFEAVRRRLKKESIEIVVRRTSFFNLEDSMRLFSDLIREFKEEQIFINISSGSKIQALAGFISAMSAKAHGITVTTYYVEPDYYTEDPPKDSLSHGFKNAFELPVFPLTTPSEEVQFAMNLLKLKPYSKLELAIELAKQGHFDKNLISFDKKKPIDDNARIRLQNQVEYKVIQPMLQSEYATTVRRGRSIIVKLTDFGEEATHLFMSYD